MSSKFYEVKLGQDVIVKRLQLADSFTTRLVGLMFKGPPADKDGLLFEDCRSLHTHFMTYPLDVVFLDKGTPIHSLYFLDKNDRVVRVIKEMKPWRMTRPYFKASKAFEVKVGSLAREVKPGDQLEVKCIS